MKNVAALGLFVCLTLLGAACNDSSDDATDTASSQVAATSVAIATAEATGVAVETPVATQAPEPPQAPESPQDVDSGEESFGDISPEFVRNFIVDGLVQDSGISEASAQCVGENLSDDLLERYLALDLEAPGAEVEAQPVLAEMVEVQASCLTPEEMEQMGFAPAEG